MLRLLPLVLLLAPAAPAQLTPRQELRDTPVARVAREVGPAVLNVYQEVESELGFPWNRIYGPMRTRRTSLGSGFLIDADGYILTNAHVIQSGEKGIHVRLADGSDHPAERVNVDPDNDVALLKITPPPGVTLPVVRLGTSSDVMVGESIVAIGNPLGNENSVSGGIVSSVFREVRVPGPRGDEGSPVFKDSIQFDAPINPGNSGGPLLNVLGEVIGITFAIANEAQGISFAIPIDRVRETLTQNLLDPRMQRGVVTGFEVQGDPILRAVTLADVEPDSPAAKAGLHAGDRLVSIAGKAVEWEFDYNKALLSSRPGDKVDVVVERDDRTLRTALTLGQDDSPVQMLWRRMGLSVVNHPRYKGVRVERVDPVGPAAQLGLQAGDLIDGLGDREIDSLSQLFQIVRGLPPDTQVIVHVWRGNGASYGPLKLK